MHPHEEVSGHQAVLWVFGGLEIEVCSKLLFQLLEYLRNCLLFTVGGHFGASRDK